MEMTNKVGIPTCGGAGSTYKRLFAFKELFADFVAGTPIKREVWKGYWKYRYGKVEMHGKDGVITFLTDTQDILFTLSGILQNDWEVATTENSSLEV